MGRHVDIPPVDIRSEVAILLEEWIPPEQGEVEVMPEAVELALCKIGRSLEKHSAHMAVETMGWLFLTVLKRDIKEKNVLLQEA